MDIIAKITARRHKYHIAVVFGMSCLLVIIVSNEHLLFAEGDPNLMTNQMGAETAAPRSKAGTIIDAAKALFSLPTSPGRWALKLKDAFRYGRNYFSPPNIDFRGGRDSNAEEGAGEKVKEALVKTMDESKATVEGSAKSAAKFTEEAVDKTVNKLKTSFSRHEEGEEEHETEL